MEKGNYSINDLKNLFNIFKVGDILYFRNADIVKDHGSIYDIEIEVKVVRIDRGKIHVECIAYYDGRYIVNLSFNTPHVVEEKDYKYLFRKSMYF